MNAYHFQGFTVPARLVESLEAYARDRRPVSAFLRAVLDNNFAAACSFADDDNARNLPAFAGYVYNEMPHACHGSPERVDDWLARCEVTA